MPPILKVAILSALGVTALSFAAASDTLPAKTPTGNSGGLDPSRKIATEGATAANQINNADRLFAQLAAGGGMAEVALGKLTADKSGDANIKAFAHAMIDEHGAANETLKRIADKNKISLPTKLGIQHEQMRVDLGKQDGLDYDLAYLQAQIIEHATTIQLLEWEIDSGQNAEMQAFAKDTLPKVLHHLEMARALLARASLLADRS